ncbi:hypothetical protein P8452_56785 [Trifolium repens]|nr:hypothetical protein P8452_56785 [Trifolium repens]
MMERSLQVQVQPSVENSLLSMQDSIDSPDKDISMICEKLRNSGDLGIVDIDSKLKDSLFWTSYAPDIYNSIYVREVCVVKYLLFLFHLDYSC